MGKKDVKLTQPSSTKRKKRNQQSSENIFVDKDESAARFKRIKIIKVKKSNSKGDPKKTTLATNFPALSEVSKYSSSYETEELLDISN